MRVVYVTSTTSQFGGSGRAFINMLEGLLKYGVQPLVIFPNSDGLCELLNNRGIPIRVLNYRMATYPPIKTLYDIILFFPRLICRILLNTVASLRLCNIAKEYNADLIHTNVSVIDIGYNASRKLNIPHIWHIREYGVLDFHYYYYYCRKQHLKKLKQLNSYSICITRDIMRYNNLIDDVDTQSKTIYDGVLSDKQVRFDKDKDSYFLFAGAIIPSKGIGDLIDAYMLFRQKKPNSRIRLKIAGDSNDQKYKNYLYDKIKKNQIQEYVDFLGMRADVLDLMFKAYLMIVPSTSEGFGFITTEAMFNGALVLGRNTAGTKEQFDNGLNLTGKEIGLRYDTQSELIQQMCEVENNGIEYYFSMIERSQKVVQKLYSMEQHSMKVCDFYKMILHK